MQGARRQYESPVVRDYGDLRGITASLHPLVGAGGTDLSFSTPSPHNPVGGGPQNATGGTGGVADSGGGSSGGGSSGGGSGGGGGGSLPFTGLIVGAIAAAGSGLTAAGALLSKLARRGDDS
jgi:alkaline phosphatase